jgi:hypothetical protein
MRDGAQQTVAQNSGYADVRVGLEGIRNNLQTDAELLLNDLIAALFPIDHSPGKMRHLSIAEPG